MLTEKIGEMDENRAQSNTPHITGYTPCNPMNDENTLRSQYSNLYSDYAKILDQVKKFGKEFQEVGKQMIEDHSRLRLSPELMESPPSKPTGGVGITKTSKEEWLGYAELLKLLQDARALRSAHQDVYNQLPSHQRGGLPFPL
jgi:hypothetical protein